MNSTFDHTTGKMDPRSRARQAPLLGQALMVSKPLKVEGGEGGGGASWSFLASGVKDTEPNGNGVSAR